jgi:preprotein translocase subunit SecF
LIASVRIRGRERGESFIDRVGGEVLNSIALALLAGITVATCLSIFVASALLVLWHEYKGSRYDSR